jgi:hypothetical protein
VFGEKFDYVGNNQFAYPGLPPGMFWTLRFELQEDGSVRLTETISEENIRKKVNLYTKG